MGFLAAKLQPFGESFARLGGAIFKQEFDESFTCEES